MTNRLIRDVFSDTVSMFVTWKSNINKDFSLVGTAHLNAALK